MRARAAGLVLAGVMLGSLAGAGVAQAVPLAPLASEADGPLPVNPPLPDPNFATTVTESECTLENDDPYIRETYALEGWEPPEYSRYPGHCQRMHFAYGPILVKPGQNDVLVGPVTIEKPAQDGYITRFKPNLIDGDASIPPVHELHLHHGTWLALTNDYGNSAFFAAGEEKTIAPFPRGYGMEIKATDQWQLLYMVHSAVTNPTLVWITYDIDFIPKADGEALGMKPVVPVWLDVRPAAYPVFNVQRKYGGADGECTWPKERCADFDPFGNPFTGQGLDGNGVGTDFRLPEQGGSIGSATDFQGGTLIGIGGHVHPGGIRNEIDLVRDGQAQRIYNGVPSYWTRDGNPQPGGPPTSWDFSMRVSGLPNWGVHVEPGDILRSNATYDTTYQSSYEDMGIAIALLAPDDADGNPQAPGVDPFAVTQDTSERCDSGGLQATPPELCVNGFRETHGQYEENLDYGGPEGDLAGAPDGPQTTEVGIADFLYAPGDLSTVDSVGIPTVKLGSTLTFHNADGALIPHTITTCRYPCTGPTGSAFPLADGETSTGRLLDLDSSELYVGAPEIGPATQRLDWSTPITSEEGYTPGEVVTYFCRIHPSMRGAFKVVE